MESYSRRTGARLALSIAEPNTGDFLQHAPAIEAELKKVPGVVDSFDGLVYAGSSVSLKVRSLDAQRFGLTAEDIATAINIAMLGETSSTVLEGDRVVDIRVKVEGCMANITWDRGLGYALERPKSVTTAMLEKWAEEGGRKLS